MDSQDSLVCNRTSQVCLGPSSWQQLNSTGPSAEHSPVPWPAASPQRQPVWPYPPVGACLPPPHCPDCCTLGPAHCSQAPTHPPTHPQPKSATLPLRNFARMGQAAQAWRKDPNPESLGERRLDAPKLLLVSRVLSRLGKAPPSFLPSPHSPNRPRHPCQRLGSEGKLISNTQTPPAASPTEGAKNRGMREKILKINSGASPSPADWLSGGLRVRVQFVVATAAGQGMKGEGERDSPQRWNLGLWKAENQIFFIPCTPRRGNIWEKKKNPVS